MYNAPKEHFCARLTAYAADNEHFFRADMRHRALRDFDEHSKNSFLQGKTKIFSRKRIAGRGGGEARIASISLGLSQDTTKGDIHAFGSVWNGQQTLATSGRVVISRERQVDRKTDTPFGPLLDIESRTGVIGETNDTGETIEAVANSDIQSFTKNAVTMLTIGNDLCIAARNIEHHRVRRASDGPTHFNILRGCNE